MSKRFVTYRTEDAAAGLVNVDENGVLKTGGGGEGGVSSWNDLADKPFEDGQVTISGLEFANLEVAYRGYDDSGEGGYTYYLIHQGSVPFDVWKKLKVYYTYSYEEEYVLYETYNDGYTRYYTDNTYTGVPLKLELFDGNRTLYTADEQTVTPPAGIYYVYGYQSAKIDYHKIVFGDIHTIDPKYLPYNIFVINYDIDRNNYDKTWDEVVEAYNNGAMLFVKTGVPGDSEFFQPPMLQPLSFIDTTENNSMGHGYAHFCGLYYDYSERAYYISHTEIRQSGSAGGGRCKLSVEEV